MYENFVKMGDLNIDTADKTKGTYNYFSDLRDTFSLTKIINSQHVSKNKKVNLLTFCLQTGQGVLTREAFLKNVLAIITN